MLSPLQESVYSKLKKFSLLTIYIFILYTLIGEQNRAIEVFFSYSPEVFCIFERGSSKDVLVRSI